MAVAETLSSVTRKVVLGSPGAAETAVIIGAIAARRIIPRRVDDMGARLIEASERGLERVFDLPDAEDHQ
jgi:hypothetical protein